MSKNIFSNLFLHAFSQSCNPKELLIYSGMVKEHGFKGFITDLATINEYDLNNKETICSLNYPYNNLSPNCILQFINSKNLDELTNITSLMVGLNKFDVINNRWGNVRNFLIELNSITKKNIHLVIDIAQLKHQDEISTYFSIIRSYSNINPVISSLGVNNLDKVLSTINESVNKNVSFFTFQQYSRANLEHQIKRGFTDIMVSGKTAVGLIQNE